MAKRERTETLVVMLTAAEKAIVKAKADTQGMTMSSYARWVLLNDAKKEAEKNG